MHDQSNAILSLQLERKMAVTYQAELAKLAAWFKENVRRNADEIVRLIQQRTALCKDRDLPRGLDAELEIIRDNNSTMEALEKLYPA